MDLEFFGISRTIGWMTRRRLLNALLMLVFLASAGIPTRVVFGDDIPNSAYVDGVIGHAQQHTLSCEARSSVDLAAFWGITFTEEEFMDRIPISDNPDKGFVGSLDGSWGFIPPRSYGVHAAPVVKALKKLGLRARNETGMSQDDLKREIAAGKPVIVWVIGQVWRGEGLIYTTESGEDITVAHYEHTMIMTGYSSESVELVDAFTGSYLYYSWTAFLKSWGVLGNMSVVVDGLKEDTSVTPTPTPEPVKKTNKKTYTVQQGDYLIEIARQYNLDWRKIAELNNLYYPWIIYPGQVLHLK